MNGAGKPELVLDAATLLCLFDLFRLESLTGTTPLDWWVTHEPLAMLAAEIWEQKRRRKVRRRWVAAGLGALAVVVTISIRRWQKAAKERWELR